MQLLLLLALSPTIFSTRLRPLFLFWGGLFSLGSTEINQTKILYLVGITLSLVVTILQTQFQLQAKQNRYIPSRYHVVFVIVLLLYFVNFFSAIYSGYAVTDIFQFIYDVFALAFPCWNDKLHLHNIHKMTFKAINVFIK